MAEQAGPWATASAACRSQRKCAMKKVSPVIVVGLLLTAACLALYILNPFFMRTISSSGCDYFMRAVCKPPQSGRVVIIDIDRESLAEQGQWPWPRYRMATLTRLLLDAGALVVAYDVVFAEPDQGSPLLYERRIGQDFGVDVEVTGLSGPERDFDKLFADVLASGPTVLGCFLRPIERDEDADQEADPNYRGWFYLRGLRDAGDARDHLKRLDGIDLSTSVLRDSAADNAFLNAIPDADNVVRRMPLAMASGPMRIYPSLALSAARIAAGANQVGIHYDAQGIEFLRLRDITVPTDGAGRIVINYRALQQANATDVGYSSFPTYSATRVLTGQVRPETFTNKVVFVGTSAAGLRDLRATPLAYDFAGVEIHATVADNILAGDMLLHPWWSPATDTFSIALLGIVLTLVVHKCRAWLSFLLTVAVTGAAVAGSYFLLTHMGFIFVPVRVVMSAIILYPVLTMIRYWQAELQKSKVRNMFGTMVSTKVLRYLENNPASFSLTGQKMDATMSFSDISGFTPISEDLEPARLAGLLNQYLSPMTDIIMSHNGYVDKYEGDAIMAEWGVPFAMPDHATQACLAALEQQKTLAQIRPTLRAEFGHTINVRIGLNTGSVTAGNMGCGRRFQYTVMGDAVNLAARFELANKEYNTSIIIGRPTFLAARDAIEARLLDLIVVRGKTEPVYIYELLARKGELAQEQEQVVRLYEEALKLHQARKWDEAVAHLDQALSINNTDRPSQTLRRRATRYRQNPPPPGWQGVHIWDVGE